MSETITNSKSWRQWAQIILPILAVFILIMMSIKGLAAQSNSKEIDDSIIQITTEIAQQMQFEAYAKNDKEEAEKRLYQAKEKIKELEVILDKVRKGEEVSKDFQNEGNS